MTLLNLQVSCFLCINARMKQLQSPETHMSELSEAEILELLLSFHALSSAFVNLHVQIKLKLNS